jgi:hypothetical protein
VARMQRRVWAACILTAGFAAIGAAAGCSSGSNDTPAPNPEAGSSGNDSGGGSSGSSSGGSSSGSSSSGVGAGGGSSSGGASSSGSGGAITDSGVANSDAGATGADTLLWSFDGLGKFDVPDGGVSLWGCDSYGTVPVDGGDGGLPLTGTPPFLYYYLSCPPHSTISFDPTTGSPSPGSLKNTDHINA